jgi:glutamate synthase (NADPH/NADH) small chain
MPEPPKQRSVDQPWPKYPFILRKSSSHEEGKVERFWSVMTKEFTGNDGKISGLKCSKCEFIKTPKPGFREIKEKTYYRSFFKRIN